MEVGAGPDGPDGVGLGEQLLRTAISNTGSKIINLFNRGVATGFFLFTDRSPGSFEIAVTFPFTRQQEVQ